MAAAAEPAAMPAMSTAPAAMAPATAAKTEAEGDARPVIGGIIGIRIVIGRRRRRAIGISRRRRRIIASPIIGSLTVVLMHAAIIGVGISGLDIARRMAGIVGADGGAGEQPGARAGGSAKTGVPGGRTQHGAQHRATNGAANRAAGLFVTRGFARRGVAGAGRGVAAAEDVAIGLRLLLARRAAGIGVVARRRRVI